MRVSTLSSSPVRLPLMICVAGCLLTIVCGYQMQVNHNRKVVERFQRMAETTVNQVALRMQPYAYGLRGARGVVIGAGGPSITRSIFKSYIASRDFYQEFPGLRGFGFIRIVSPEDEQAFVNKVRAEGFPEFKIQQLAPHDGERYVIEFIEPLADNQAAMGLDIASEPKRRAAAQSAMLSGKPTITEPITLVQVDRKKNSGFLMLLPVYESVKNAYSAVDRQQNIFAWVYAPLLIDEILQGINDNNNEVGVTITDVKANQSFYSSYSRNVKPVKNFLYQKSIMIAERQWSFSFIALPAFARYLAAPQIYLTMIAMLIGTLIIAGFFYQLLLTQKRNIQINVNHQKRLRLRAIMDAVPCGILMMDARGRMREVNEGLCVMLGYDRDSLLEQSLKTILPERYLQNRPQLIAELLQQASDQPDGVNIAFKALCQTGAELPVSVDFKQMQDGKEVTLIATWIDISERRKQERQLREYAELQRAMLANAGYAIIATDSKGIITVFNPAAENMLGYSAQEMIGQRTPQILHDEFEIRARAEFLSAELQRVVNVGFETFVVKAKLGHADINEWTYIRKDGSRFPVLLTISCLLHDDGDVLGYLGIAADLTEQKRVEEQFLLAVEAAEAAALTKSEFLANMSHEIRTPMNGIIGMTAITLETQLTVIQREYLTLVQDSANYLLQLINDILDFSKMESGKLKLSPIDFQVRDFLKKRLKVLDKMAEQKQIKLMIEVHESVPNWLHGDPDRWIQIIINFISNAIKFTQQGSVKLVLQIAQSVDGDLAGFKPADDKVLLHCNVIDTGIGIPFAAQQHIFEAFSQADASTTRRYGGTGLGLSICKQITDLMGGRIWVESQQGVGSQFQLLIPFVQVSSEGQMAEELAELDQVLEANKTSAPLNVLLAEDHPVNQKIVIEILTYRGHRVTLAENGYQVLEQYAQDVFDVILMDIQMPGMDGETATTAIRLLERDTGTHVRIIGLTAHALIGDKERLLKIGMDGYLSKPFMPQELIQQVEILPSSRSDSVLAMPVTIREEASTLLIFNRQEALERAMGEITFLKKLSAVFIENVPSMRSDMQQAFDKTDDVALARATHRFKGSVANFSSPACVDVAKKIEEAAESADWPAITHLMQQWDQQVENLVRLLKELD